MENKFYEAPQVDIVEVEVEKGFAESNEDVEVDWM